MHRVLSLFIMLLLALRGLAGDAMAIESPAAHDPVHAIAAATAVATHMSHDMHDTYDKSGDEHAHHQPAAHAATDLSQCDSAHSSDCNAHEQEHEHEHEHSHCTTCGLCHTAMGQADHLVLASPGPAPSQPSLEADRFISVAAASLIKPPISGV